jgi:CheY-like chemotaxis protein
MAGERPLILVVDDAADARLMYATYLKHHGFPVIEATDGEGRCARRRSTCPRSS